MSCLNLTVWALATAGRVLADWGHDACHLQLTSNHQRKQPSRLCVRCHVYDQHHLLSQDSVAAGDGIHVAALVGHSPLAQELQRSANRRHGASHSVLGCGWVHVLFVRYLPQVMPSTGVCSMLGQNTFCHTHDRPFVAAVIFLFDMKYTL